MYLRASEFTLTLFLVTCLPTTMLDQRSLQTAFCNTFVPPREITSERLRLAPLAPSFNELDYEACQASQGHLSKTMQWGGWPQATMTLADNLRDLERHWSEFENNEAYAYTVLAPAGKPVVGCVYLAPVEGDARGITMAFWVTQDQLASDLDSHLVQTVLAELERAWPVDSVTIPIPEQDPRGMKVLADLGLEVAEMSDRQQTYVWRRGDRDIKFAEGLQGLEASGGVEANFTVGDQKFTHFARE